ncbi:MAG TPA: hypothetical protein VJP40_03485 [bacterium]|nr:hypothetical protein [bacterium]
MAATVQESAWLASLASSVDSTTAKRELLSLRAERDPELLAGGMLSFASRHAEDSSLALRIYQHISNSPQDYGAALARRAHDRAEAFHGRGNFGDRSELFVQRFVHEVTNPATLASMAIAGGVFQGLRFACYNRLLAGADATFLTRGLGARSVSFGLGFAAEAPAFTAAHRGLSALFGQEPSGAGFGQELAGAYLMLGGLRLSSGAGAWLLRGLGPVGGLTGTISQRLFQQGTMFAGITTAHWAEERLGLRQANGGEALLADSLASLILFNASGRLLHSLGGGRLGEEWGQRIRFLENIPPSSPPRMTADLALNPALAPAGPATPNQIFVPRPAQMSARNPKARGRMSTILLSTGSPSAPDAKPITRNPELYSRYRAAMGEAEYTVHLLFIDLNSGSPMWVETALGISRMLFENCRADLPRVPTDHAPIQETLVRNLEQIQASIELIRNSGPPTPMDASARDLIGHLYRVPNLIINYVDSGHPGSLRSAARNAVDANALLNRVLLPPHLVNRDSGETSPEWAQAGSGGRVVLSSKRTWKQDALPIYDYISDTTSFLDIRPDVPRRVLLLGDVPKDRSILTMNHDISLGQISRPAHRDLITQSFMLPNPRPMRLLPLSDSKPFEYVEAYNLFDAKTLQTESGRAGLERDFFQKIQPGGMGLWMSRDGYATELAVRAALERNLADVQIGSYGADSPLHLPSRPEFSTINFVFFRKLPLP